MAFKCSDCGSPVGALYRDNHIIYPCSTCLDKKYNEGVVDGYKKCKIDLEKEKK